jgi:hypothetical protein
MFDPFPLAIRGEVIVSPGFRFNEEEISMFSG